MHYKIFIRSKEVRTYTSNLPNLSLSSSYVHRLLCLSVGIGSLSLSLSLSLNLECVYVWSGLVSKSCGCM